jgi:PAS domain S-box-containing protein
MANKREEEPHPKQAAVALRWTVWRIVLVYAGFSVIWILFSDMFVAALLRDSEVFARASIFKGWAFVLVTSTLLFGLLSRELRRRQTLETSQRISQTLIDHLPQRIFFKDTQSRYVACNEGFAADVGRTPEEMVGKTDFDLYPRDLAEKYRADDQRVLAGKQVMEVDERYVVSGRERWVHTVKTPIRDTDDYALGVLGILWDITEQRAAAEALRASEDNYRRLVEDSADAIVVHREGRILYVNPMALKLCGATAREQLVGHDLFERVHPDWRERIRQRVNLVVQGDQVPLIEEKLLRMDGTPVDMEVGTTAVIFQGAPAVQSLVRDISERRRAAERLEKLNTCFTNLGADPKININHLTATCGELLGATCALYNRLNEGLLCALGQWQTPPDFQPQDHPEGHICHDVIRRGSDQDVFLVRDLQHTAYVESDPNVRPYALQTYVGKAVFFGGQAVGSLCVVFQKDFVPTEDDRKILHIIAAAISLEEERQHAEAALRESERRFRTLFEQAGVGVAHLETATGRFLKINQRYCEIIGYTAEEMQGRTFASITHPDDVQPDLANMEDLIAGRTRGFAMEKRYIRKDGAMVWVQLTVSPLWAPGEKPQFHVAVVQDITARKQAEEQSRRLVAMVEQSAEAVVMTDMLGAILYVNPAFERLSGYTRDEVLGRNPRCLKSGKQDAEFYRAMWTTLAAGQPWSGHFTNRRKDGSLYEVEAVISPIRDEVGRATFFISSARDVTRELQLENQFRQAQKMETIGRLAGGVAHDFNNLLQTILGFCELLQANTPPADARHDDVNQIQRAAKRAANLTQQLLAFSRKQMIEPRVINLNTVIGETEKMLRRLIGENIPLGTELAPDLHRIKADAGQIEQILMNLAVNARDAMPQGGRMTIRTENITFGPDEADTLSGVRSGEFVLLSFTDTGYGMTADVQEHIFEPFFSTKGLGKGTGLGLAVIYGVVSQNNGWITVYSQPGQGTTFKIYLPAFHGAEPAAPPENVRLEQQAPRGRGEHILLVEDEPDVRNLAAHLLQNYGYTLSIAESGQAARAIIAETRQPFDALFSDIVLPDTNGIALADELRMSQPTLPVLLCSGYSDALTRWSDIGTKGYHFLQKPYPATALLTLLRHTLDTRQGAPGRPPP